MSDHYCCQCDALVDLADPESVEVYHGAFTDDDPPFYFCSVSCAGTFLTDLSLV